MSNDISNNDIIQGFDDEQDESLTVNIQKVELLDNCLVIVLNGYIDTYNSTFFQKKVSKVISAGYVRVVFDCTSLNYVSSTGIGSFTSFLKTLKPLGGDIVLLNVQPKVYEVFQLLGFSQFFNIKDTLSDAIIFFQAGNIQEKTDMFPKIFECPICTRKLKALKAGRFRCAGCKTILAVDNNAQVSLG